MTNPATGSHTLDELNVIAEGGPAWKEAWTSLPIGRRTNFRKMRQMPTTSIEAALFLGRWTRSRTLSPWVTTVALLILAIVGGSQDAFDGQAVFFVVNGAAIVGSFWLGPRSRRDRKIETDLRRMMAGDQPASSN